ncbi:MAG: coenzyme F420-0:L-glutamate ligase, partial [Rhodospirillales bacterium]|nr:coenzyme F420-0:L-glutamate ligase [Rhodospirillales bacterium]
MNERVITITALGGIPRVRPGDDLAAHLIAAIANAGIKPRRQDVIVVAQKIVSKAEGRYLDLARVVPSTRARELAEETGKDARLVEAILQESDEVVRTRAQVLIVAHRLGFVMANAGIDRSNIDLGLGDDPVLLLPRDPDASAKDIKRRLDAHFGTSLGVVISDSFGRAWRIGTVGVAIGVAGLPAVVDCRGEADLNGHPLMVTVTGFADAVAASAVETGTALAESVGPGQTALRSPHRVEIQGVNG